MSFAFVILHYLVPDITCECIDLLLELPGAEAVHVVVVDNASPDGSGKMLAGRYSADPRVCVISSKTNLGFAKGNNLGYEYAMQHFNPDFVVVMNNDLMVRDPHFIQKVEAEYAERPFAVLGPDIYSPAAGVHQNPVRLKGMNLQQVKHLRMKMNAKYRLHLWHYLSWNLKLMLGLAARSKAKNGPFEQAHEDCVLFGACYIFSRDFTKVRKHCFNPDTFMYTEEDILHYECMRDGLKMRYTPAIGVDHLEDLATNAAFSSPYLRSKIKYGRLVDSLDVLINLMENK